VRNASPSFFSDPWIAAATDNVERHLIQSKTMPDSRQEIKEYFRGTAAQYDWGVRMYRLMGVDDRRYRRDTVAALGLRPGDTVIDLACGTGLNFPWLEKAVGPSGKIIGVDLSPAMLARARRRLEKAGWGNIELAEAALEEYPFPSAAAGMLSTFSMYLVADSEDVVRRAAAALRPGGRLAILDAKLADLPPAWTALYPRWRREPFGIDPSYLAQRPMDHIRRHMREVLYREYYFGYLYLSVGQAVPRRAPPREAAAAAP
jgi:ubiquinone/menaquinone biosynthesis C-methylase UbiE